MNLSSGDWAREKVPAMNSKDTASHRFISHSFVAGTLTDLLLVD
jgi:hypothetical protein